MKLCTDSKLPLWLSSYLSGLETLKQDLEEQGNFGLDDLFEDQSAVAHISDGPISDGITHKSDAPISRRSRNKAEGHMIINDWDPLATVDVNALDETVLPFVNKGIDAIN